jgi:hypothetical protein
MALGAIGVAGTAWVATLHPSRQDRSLAEIVRFLQFLSEFHKVLRGGFSDDVKRTYSEAGTDRERRRAFPELYGQRWNIETDLRSLKSTLQLEQLSYVTSGSSARGASQLAL